MKIRHGIRVQMIPISAIAVVNGRSRGRGKFRQIVSNIASIGLKKPITVARRADREGQERYELVCGQGRLEAFAALGQQEVPALVIDAEKDELLLMSLVENIARRRFTTVDMAREIVAMRERGLKPAEIAKKVDLDPTYVNGILRLMKHGEQRLLIAVEKREIPLSIAVMISESPDQDVQRAMAEAYDSGELRGKALIKARRVIEMRRLRGKSGRTGRGRGVEMDAGSLVKAYKKEAARQTILVNRARLCENRIRFVSSAMKRLFANESFVTLLRAEGLTTLPQYLADQVHGKVAAHAS